MDFGTTVPASGSQLAFPTEVRKYAKFFRNRSTRGKHATYKRLVTENFGKIV